MKTQNLIFKSIVIILTGIIIVLFIKFHDYKSSLYPKTTVVVHISEATNTVTIRDINGNLFQFKEIEDWMVGDVCSVIMDSKGTEYIEDDEIVLNTRYDGHVKMWKEELEY